MRILLKNIALIKNKCVINEKHVAIREVNIFAENLRRNIADINNRDFAVALKHEGDKR